MRRILILHREDLVPTCKLIEVSDAELGNFKGQSTHWIEADIVVFNCSLTGKAKIVKNRFGAKEVIDMTSTEGENEILSLILGT